MAKRGLEGNMQAQPRVFAHDAVLVVPGQVNIKAENGGISNIVGKGAGYSGSLMGANTTVSPAGGTGLTVDIIVSNGGVTKVSVNNPGSGYNVGDLIKIIGSTPGNEASVFITNTDIPDTINRGCCLYVGGSGSVEAVMESGNTATFTGVNAGSFLPVLVTKVVPGGNTDATNILAIY